MRLSLLSSIRTRSLALAGVLLLAAVVAPLSASASFINFPNNRWAWNNGHHDLLLFFDDRCTGTTAASSVEVATNAWSNAIDFRRGSLAMPVRFMKLPILGCGQLAPQFVNTQLTVQNTGLIAWTINFHQHCFIGCWWDAGSSDTIQASLIELNEPAFDQLLPGDQQAVVAHELGHSLGLDHSGYSAGWPFGCISVMDFLSCGIERPQPYDWQDINELYPGW